MLDASQHGQTLLQLPFTTTGVTRCLLRRSRGVEIKVKESVGHLGSDRELTSASTYTADELFVIHAADFRAELLVCALVPCRHHDPGDGEAVGTRATRFTPLLLQLVTMEHLAAWEERVVTHYVSKLDWTALVHRVSPYLRCRTGSLCHQSS